MPHAARAGGDRGGGLGGGGELVTRARAQVERYRLAGYPAAALVFATSALVRAHRGRVEAAQQDFQMARRLQDGMIDAAGWYAVELAVVLARTAIRLSDPTGAATSS